MIPFHNLRPRFLFSPDGTGSETPDAEENQPTSRHSDGAGRQRKPVWIVMGVSGSGKSHIGSMLANHYDLPFLDADDLHPPENVRRMASGEPLTDRDREPWLQALATRLSDAARDRGIVLACSALKASYRELLASCLPRPPLWIWLDGEKELIRDRLRARESHFMPDTLLDSQFQDLEEPDRAIRIDVHASPEEIATRLAQEPALRATLPASFIPESLPIVGLVGLGVMGWNLALNLRDHNVPLVVFNRVEPDGNRPLLRFLEETGGSLLPDHDPEGEATEVVIRSQPEPSASDSGGDGPSVAGTESLATLAAHLTPPRTILLMVPAGDAVDEVIRELLPHLDPGDLVIDGGNSHFEASERRGEALRREGVEFVGMGISGGAEGARNGPALMPGGSSDGWQRVASVARAVAATAPDGSPCCRWMGSGGAGHFVKMVHNGIEYAEMELIAESATLLEEAGGLDFDGIAETFEQWSRTQQGGYLTELTAQIHRKPDRDGAPLLTKVRDRAGQKGTGRWCVVAALELGVPTPLIQAAVQARILSSHPARSGRTVLPDEEKEVTTTGRATSPSFTLNVIEEALLAARLLAFAEGLHLLQTASSLHHWSVPLYSVLQNWKAGSILRSGLLQPFQESLPVDAATLHPLRWNAIAHSLEALKPSLRLATTLALEHHLPAPALGAALTSLDTLNRQVLPTRLIQAQRDGFGHHTFERTDKPIGFSFHADWTDHTPESGQDIDP